MNRGKAHKIEVNIYDGGMASFAEGNSLINAVQNNNNSRVKSNYVNAQCEFQNNKKQDYIDNWNSRLFLHIDNDERPLTLADAFIMPHYEYHIKDRRMNFSEIDTMDEVIEKFIKHNRSANMLIVGAPGIGKTSIVSWIANEYKENDDIIILRFRDWEKEELCNGISKAICNTLSCVKRDLENKIIILDGFDEIKALDIGEILIRDFLNELRDFKNTKVIVTSRTDYLEDYIFESSFGLLPFQNNEIKQFYNMITGNELKNDLEDSNLEVLGIPVILYMAIMSNIDITKIATKPELYGKIFAEKGGIFDRFSFRGNGYDYGNQPLRDKKNIKIYLGFLQEIAFRMFEADNLSIDIRKDEIPKLTFQGTEVSILEFPIRHLFDKTVTKIEFIHKSIYEYFVSEYIILNICNLTETNDCEEELACFFGMTLKNNKISTELLEFLKYKINVSALYVEFNKVVHAFQLMLEDGMTYYTYSYYKNVITCEMNIFYNMLDIIHLWKNKIFVMSDLFFHYIKPNRNYSFNLSKIDFHGVNLRGIDLRCSNLSGADLSGIDLSGIDLREADLREANLKGANLRGSNLSGANLRNADLRNANLREINLREADLREADLREADLSKGIIRETDLSQAKLSRVNLSESDLRWSTLLNVDINDISGINMRNAKIEYSIWMENDIRRILSELNEVGSVYFAINDKCGKKRVYRRDVLIEKI